MSTQVQLEHNWAIALRFNKSQGTPEMPQVDGEVLSPNCARAHGGRAFCAGLHRVGLRLGGYEPAFAGWRAVLRRSGCDSVIRISALFWIA